MQIPKFLKIGGHKVKIEIVSYEPHIYGNMGVDWSAYNLIQINERYPDSQKQETLLHELMHHIMTHLGIEYKKDDATALHCERNVEALAQSIFQVFNDNPKLLEMFLKK